MLGVRAFELEAGGPAGHGIEHADAVAVARVEAHVGGGQLDNLRRAVKSVEDEDAVFIGQLEAGSNFRGAGALLVAGRGLFLVNVFGFLHGRGRNIVGRGVVGAAPFFGGAPVDQLVGQLLPIVALLGEIADAVADDFVLAHELVAAVLEDKAMIALLAGRVGLEGQGLAGLLGNGINRLAGGGLAGRRPGRGLGLGRSWATRKKGGKKQDRTHRQQAPSIHKFRHGHPV